MNFFGQLPPQFNNKYINNNLVSGYQNHYNTNIPFNQNSMLKSNPLFFGNIRDSNFHNRVNMAKLEQIKKIKSVKDMGIDDTQLINYIISPIKVEKIDKKELENLHNTRKSNYLGLNDPNILDMSKLPALVMEWYNSRKNSPYKNILKNENYNKQFKDKSDLLVYKYTQLDKDFVILESELKEIIKILKTQDAKLKEIYCESEKNNFETKFEYINKSKNRVKYDPHDYNSLKEYYKKEQKKISRESKRLDEMIEAVLNDGILSKEDYDNLKTNDNDDNNKLDDSIFEETDKKIEKQLEKELIKTFGKKEFNRLMSEISDDSTNKSKKNKEHTNDDSIDDSINDKYKNRKIKLTETEIEKEKPKKNRIKINKNINKNEVIIVEEDDILSKYKNRKNNK
jgi:hypothetical protein